MKAISIFAFVAIIGMCSGLPITKWFKTDNNTYYIETQQTFTWQQSYDECQKKNLDLISIESYKEDLLLTEYLKQMFETVPEFWLKSSDKVDLNNINQLLASLMSEQFINIKLNGMDSPDVIQSDKPDNCALSAAGTGKACETMHGYICKDKSSNGNTGQNIQNIVLKFT